MVLINAVGKRNKEQHSGAECSAGERGQHWQSCTARRALFSVPIQTSENTVSTHQEKTQRFPSHFLC